MKKKDKIIKARTCTNGSVQRAWMKKEEKLSSTAYMKSIMITPVMDTKEDRDVATTDIPIFSFRHQYIGNLERKI